MYTIKQLMSPNSKAEIEPLSEMPEADRRDTRYSLDEAVEWRTEKPAHCFGTRYGEASQDHWLDED